MIDEYAKCAVEAAIKAGKILRDGFGSTFTINNKEGKNNLVTEYDNLSEKTIIQYIQSSYPDHFFLAEESGSSGISNIGGVRWIIDPLDGTTNFARNLPIFSISIAAESNGELLCGVIYQPILDELFVAVRNKGSMLNNSPIKVSSNQDFESSFLITGFPYNINQNPCNCIENFVDIIMRGIPVRRLGSAALDLAYVAAGRFDGFWEINLNPWDVAAGVLIVEEAGGVVSQYSGKPYKIGSQSIVATNGKIHNSITEVLSLCSCNDKFED